MKSTKLLSMTLMVKFIFLIMGLMGFLLELRVNDYDLTNICQKLFQISF